MSSASTIRSAARSRSRRSPVTSPMIRTPSPGPGKGWRQTISSGSPSSSPTLRTSSLNNQRSGSTRSNSMSSGRPPTLWWDLMVDALPWPDSMTSGYSVPCTRYLASPACSRAACSKTRMNSRPMILRFSSGSVTPARCSRNWSAALTVTRLTSKCSPKASWTCSASPWRSRPWSTKTQVSLSPMARWTSAAATAESTPPDSPHSTSASPTWARIASTDSSITLKAVHDGWAPAACRKDLMTSWPCGVWLTSGWYWTLKIPFSGASMAAT